MARTTDRQADVTQIPGLGLKAWSGRSDGMPVAHRHHDLELNYVLDGPMTYLIGGSLITLPHHRVCVLWGGTAHQAIHHTGAPARLIWATVPLGQVLSWELPEALVRPLLERGLAIDPADDADAADAGMLRRWERDLAKPDPARRRIVLLELEARLRRLALSLNEPEPRPADPASPETADPTALPPRPPDALHAVQQMAHHISAHFHEPLRAADIARAARLHPNYAMSLFRHHTGMTLNGYLTQQRIAHAQRLLATTQRPILQIAFDSGFGSASRFFEAFKQHTGQTPRHFRQQLARH